MAVVTLYLEVSVTNHILAYRG